MTRIYIHDFAVMSRLGMSAQETRESLASASPPRPDTPFALLDGQSTQVARLPRALPDMPGVRTRTNRIASALLTQMKDGLETLLSAQDRARIAVVVGTSTTGIEEALGSLSHRMETGSWAEDFRLADQELGDLAAHIQTEAGTAGPAYAVSTACTSATKAILSAARLIRTGLADAAICGGVDSLAQLTVNGFHALASVSPGQCAPFSANRNGINIGEGGALFLISKTPSEWELAGGGESSDAHHISAPDPTGTQAERAIRMALKAADLTPDQIDFVHMHGTGTEQNDRAEAGIVNRVFGPDMPAMSTKGMTGHTLGAAGGLQLAINLICMREGLYPPHVYDGAFDDTLAPIALTKPQQRAGSRLDRSICASYAFGGSNAALVVSRALS